MVLRSFWCQYWPQENTFLVKQLRYFKILMAKIQCVLSYYFASLTSIQTDDPPKNCANGQHCQFLKWFLLMVVYFCALSLDHLSFFSCFGWLSFSPCEGCSVHPRLPLIVLQAPRRSLQFWSHVVPLWSIQVQKWPGHVNYTSGTNSRSICTTSFYLKHWFTNSCLKYSAK